jgi:hypothetical protein
MSRKPHIDVTTLRKGAWRTPERDGWSGSRVEIHFALGLGRVALGDVSAGDDEPGARVVGGGLVGTRAAGQDQGRGSVDRLLDFDR